MPPPGVSEWSSYTLPALLSYTLSTLHFLLSLILRSFASVWRLYTLLKAKLTHCEAFQLEYIKTYTYDVIQDLLKLGSQQQSVI